MKTVNRFFDVYPKVVHSDTTVDIKIRGAFENSTLKPNTQYFISYYPLERFSAIGEYKYQEAKKVEVVDNTITFNQFFKGEQEHLLVLQELIEGELKIIAKFSLYSLEEDLFARKPFKGDMHMHSFYSDGKESPAFVAAYCRKIGLDFMALTDHGQYTPSIVSQEAFANVDTDLLICRGEEVHPPKNPVHMINFGGSFSVNDLMRNEPDKYYKEVEEIKATITDVDDEDAKYQCASSLWVFKKIREGNGMSIFCHPYWLIREGYYISDTVTSYMYEHQPYDSNEVIGGYHRHEEESNTLQVARYYEERAKGKKVPIVGVSDAHGCENSDLFGWYYTITFAKENTLPSQIESIKDLYSVAVEAIPGEATRAYGPFRLVKYAQFLIREVFPHHDELCFEEGQLMLRYASGEKEMAERIASLKGQTSSLMDRMWGK